MDNARFVWIRYKLLLNWHILDFFYLFLNRDNLNFFLRDYFLVVLRNFLDCIIVLLDHLSRDSLNNFSFLIVDYFSSFGNHFFVGPGFVVDHFLFIRHVLNSALAWNITNYYLWPPILPLLSTLSVGLPVLSWTDSDCKYLPLSLRKRSCSAVNKSSTMTAGLLHLKAGLSWRGVKLSRMMLDMIRQGFSMVM